jgi:hypothetical protein
MFPCLLLPQVGGFSGLANFWLSLRITVTDFLLATSISSLKILQPNVEG